MVRASSAISTPGRVEREVMGYQKRVECFKQRFACTLDIEREKLPGRFEQTSRCSRWLN